jgi:hypothetical protein
VSETGLTSAVTHWRSCEEPRGVRHHVALSRVFERFRTPVVGTIKEQLPGWAPVTFRNDYRNLANFECAFAVGLDVEKGETRFEATLALWSAFCCFVHTTYSHAPKAHRLRVIFPTSRPITREAEWRRVRRWLARRSNEAGQRCDPFAADPSRLWFVPGIAPGGEYLWRENGGAVLDVDAVLEQELVEEPEAPALAPVLPIPTTTTIDRARRYCPVSEVR